VDDLRASIAMIGIDRNAGVQAPAQREQINEMAADTGASGAFDRS
jgi:hypothetical protein